MFGLARMMAPAARKRATISASRGGRSFGVIGGGAAGGAHIEGVELVLDGKDDAVQRPLQAARACEFLIESARGFERVRHVGDAVGGVGLRRLAAGIEWH